MIALKALMIIIKLGLAIAAFVLGIVVIADSVRK